MDTNGGHWMLLVCPCDSSFGFLICPCLHQASSSEIALRLGSEQLRKIHLQRLAGGSRDAIYVVNDFQTQTHSFGVAFVPPSSRAS
jgi:hypothetical protein